ncbi:hypothetical protein CYMTET_8977 [Cymbomonas tetramitiformis]|uniref:Uncharacterized protein n=1 Tax=Cymbomonas tetramitiformis TaxID=36881 RepID=A0AAE0GS89_9CHLO|nr:hypothetical protein CYMTET_8977 [Cymbomonas tetramitiformis]
MAATASKNTQQRVQSSLSLDNFIRVYPGAEQVARRVRVKIPGHWFNGLPKEDLHKEFWSEAVEFKDLKTFGFAQRLTKCPGIRFQVQSDVEENPDHEGYWIKLDSWNRYRHLTYENDREAEKEFIVDEPLQVVSATETEDANVDSGNGPGKPYIYKFFSLTGSDAHKVVSGRNAGKTLKAKLFKCNLPGCPSDGDHKVVSGSTGGLYKHLDSYHEEHALECRLASSHSKVRLTEDGNVVDKMNFEEALPHHMRFVAMVARDLEHFSKSKSEGMRDWLVGLNHAYSPPSRLTSVRLLEIMADLSLDKLYAAIAQNRSELGDPHIGLQSDIWSRKDARDACVAIRASLILKLGSLLLDVCPLLAFYKFPQNRHTGVNIGRSIKTTMKNGKIPLSSVAISTGDGASNNKKAHSWLAVPFKVSVRKPSYA